MAKIEIFFPELLVVSFSRIKTWRRCQMQHHYRYYQRLRKTKKAKALWVGSAIHSCIEEHHEGRDWTEILTEFQAEYDKLFLEEKAEFGDLPGDLSSVMRGYFKFYENDGLTYPMRRRGIRTELPIQVDLDSHTRFIAYIDAYPQDERGRNWLMDHKSCKRIPEESTRFADLQLVTYNWLLPQLGYPKPDGIIWDYVKTKPPTVPELLKSGELSKSSKMDTTYQVYMDTVDLLKPKGDRKAYEEFAQQFKGREANFYRRIQLPTPSKLMEENLVRDTLCSIAEIQTLGPKAMVRNMSRDCGSFCSYYNLCQAEVRGLDSEYIRKSEFTVKGEVDDSEEENPKAADVE